jgi:hypothetical protein
MFLTKGIIVERKQNLYKVRIPIYHGLSTYSEHTPDSDLPYASVCVSSKDIKSPYNAGDVVFVYFEDERLTNPVILGHLFTEGANE